MTGAQLAVEAIALVSVLAGFAALALSIRLIEGIIRRLKADGAGQTDAHSKR